MTLWTRGKLDNLPYDILFQITSILYVKEKRCLGGCGEFTATWVLSRVSRRLRAVALYFMFRNVNLSIHKELATSLEDFLPGGRYEHMAFSVRSLTMWTLDYTYYDWCSEMPVLSLPSADFPLVNLTALEMPHLVIEDTGYSAESFSMLQRLSRLSTIRLYTAGETDLLGPEPVTTTATTSDPESPLVSYPLITTLAIYSLSLSPPHLIRECIKTCSFPNLTVFAVQNFESGNLAGLFHFIHQHPTLHEVNVDARRTTRIRVEAIMKLVDGTGTWVATNDSGIKLSTIGYLPRQTEPPDLFPPNIVPGNQVFCSSFAFTRAPLPENDRPNISCARYR
ncbi:hypothetical protein BC629DRAFT_551225 [Irpex lacteus]|nr:hypothetical protein BC629DRAFT_551225 [Irpex lacteus]